jgi:two-component system sensor histidine kinase KdpD
MRHDDQRPDPDELLKRVQEEEERSHRGKLKIFLGYVAGVGKTYAMLEAAQLRLTEGIDVVVGYVETHKRAETEELVEGLEIIPRREVDYRGVTLTEMDLDAVLTRRPALALVDELAHTNAPGLRHPKRYLDVAELLDAGIDVYTTLNIQHLESLNDVVAQITGTIVRETVPDWIIDQADDIELIDLPPQELQQRLKEGKVYVPDQAARAIQRFFRPGNLNALRELAMRRAAERVGGQMRAYMQTHAIPGPWHAEERILVCISPSVLAERLIRAARRLADEIDAEWIAIYIETAQYSRLTDKEREMLGRALRLAEELGAKTNRLPGNSVAETLIQYAQTHNVTKIMIGKPVLPYWLDMLRGSMVDQVIRRSGNIDVFIISSQVDPRQIPRAFRFRSSGPWQRYLVSIIPVLLLTPLGALLFPAVQLTNMVMLYLLGVIFVASSAGRGPGLLTALLSGAAFDYFFIPPRFTFSISDPQHSITFVGFLIVALVTSTFASRAQEQARAARRRQAQTAALFDLSRDLAATGLLNPILDVIRNFVSQTFNVLAAVMLPEEGHLRLRVSTPDYQPDDDEIAVADWAFRNGQVAGKGTSTLPAADATYLPLKTGRGIIGVLGIAPEQGDEPLSSEQMRLLEASASLAALAIERALLVESAQRANPG